MAGKNVSEITYFCVDWDIKPQLIQSVIKLLLGLVLVDQEWSKRWFVLGTDELACYRDSKDELTSDVESSISIIPGTDVSNQDVGQGYAFRISVRLSSCCIMLSADLIFDSVACMDELMYSI